MAVQTEWLEKDYYALLGVPETASEQDITRAYRRLARELHPDVNPDKPDAEERFKEVSSAYDVLGDPAKRKEYDELRQLAKAPTGRFEDDGGGFRVRFTTADDLSDLGDLGGLGDLFGDLFGSAGRQATRARRGPDVEAEVALSFEEAVTGVERKVGKATVRIPAGIEDGQLIRVPGQGGPGANGGPPGDLYVTVRVAPHRLFGRDGPHLTLRIPVTFAEGALGADIRVPTLQGEPVTLRLPPGTPSGKTFRVRGKGVPGRGDLLVTVEVAVPKRLTEAQRRAVEELAAATTESPRAYLGV
ncbi:MAG TPA: DnaJ C-terminal domain-containing protein [Acidimicrobiales bacterium]|nr:DnaJ C-terminal domain-containing protein [Acidimicrobiales bacterium]